MPDASPDPSPDGGPETRPRRRWMGLLARATRAELDAGWSSLTPAPTYRLLRRPETGLVLVRGRAGGTGAPFNLGEMTMTRCAVRLEGDTPAVGQSFVAGRDTRHAKLAAVFDALLQDPRRHTGIETSVLMPIEARLARERQARAAEVAATRVDFFTLAREQS